MLHSRTEVHAGSHIATNFVPFKSSRSPLHMQNLTNSKQRVLGEGRKIDVRAQASSCSCTSEDFATFTNKDGNPNPQTGNTNRAGKVLRQIGENVWGAERPFKWNGIDVNGRMAVLRLKDGTLWVQSPVGLSKELKSCLAELGTVKHVVSPNYEHVKFAKQWQDEYPDAIFYACPGLQDKADMQYSTELDPTSNTRPEWGDEIEYTCLSYERVPVLKKPFFNEVVFLHKPSKHVIVTDLWWNYPSQGTPAGTQAWKFGMDRIYGPFYNNFMIGNKDEYQGAMQQIFKKWDFDGIIPCHGDVLQQNGRQTLMSHLRLKEAAWPLNA